MKTRERIEAAMYAYVSIVWATRFIYSVMYERYPALLALLFACIMARCCREVMDRRTGVRE